MQASSIRRAGAALVAVGAVAAVGVSGTAQAQYDIGTGPETIQIKMNGKRPLFKGPKTISRGEVLTIKNKTSPKKIGPHTFTLFKASSLPKGKKEIKACEKIQTPVCARAVKAHKVNLKTGEVHKPNVDVGKKGWDKSYGKKGDSWVTQAKGESKGRNVVAPVGTTLRYICLVHPFMQGKIKVVD
jgi:hypothetical protein